MQYLICGDSVIITVSTIANVRVKELPDPGRPPGQKPAYRLFIVEATDENVNHRYELFRHTNLERCKQFLKAYGAFLKTSNKVVHIKDIDDWMPAQEETRESIDQQKAKLHVDLVLYKEAADALVAQLDQFVPDWDGETDLSDHQHEDVRNFYHAWKKARASIDFTLLRHTELNKELMHLDEQADTALHDEHGNIIVTAEECK